MFEIQCDICKYIKRKYAEKPVRPIWPMFFNPSIILIDCYWPSGKFTRFKLGPGLILSQLMIVLANIVRGNESPILGKTVKCILGERRSV